MRVRTKSNIEGAAGSECVVTIPITGGMEEIILHSTLVRNNSIPVERIGQRGTEVLIELPQESTKGNWRVWVPQAELVAD